eukprot:COSAG02_NODE_177_length_31154_cov_32.205152_6_plen_51_part_00
MTKHAEPKRNCNHNHISTRVFNKGRPVVRLRRSACETPTVKPYLFRLTLK